MSSGSAQREIASLRNDLKRSSSEVKQLRQELSESENTINNLNMELQRLQRANHRLETENSELRSQINELEQENTNKLDLERNNAANLKNSYETVITELKGQCESHRVDIARLANEISQSEVKMATANQEIQKLKKAKRKLRVALDAQKSQMERERKLNESTLRAEKLLAESNYNQRTEEQKMRQESEKKRIFTTVVESFIGLLDINETIDERAFKNVLDKAKKTINQLQKSDDEIRRLLSVSRGQTTLDAVAQLLMSKSGSRAQYDY